MASRRSPWLPKRQAQMDALQGGSWVDKALDWGLKRSFKDKELRDIQKRKMDLTLSGELQQGPQMPAFDQFKRGLDEVSGLGDVQGLPGTPKEAEMRALRGTLGIGGAALGVADPADEATAQAVRQLAENLGAGPTGQSIAELAGGLVSGAGAKDVGRAGMFLSRVDPISKVLNKELRDAAAKGLRGDPFWSKGTKAGKIMRKYVYDKDPNVGAKLKDILEGKTHGEIQLRDTPGGPLLETPELRMPVGNYRPEDLATLVKHEIRHRDIMKLRDKVAGWLRRKNMGGAPLTPDEQEAFDFLSDYKEAGQLTPWRPKEHPIRIALEEARVPHTAAHGMDEPMADLGATLGLPGSKEYTPVEASDIMERWLSRGDPWKATTPGDLSMVEAQINALRRQR